MKKKLIVFIISFVIVTVYTILCKFVDVGVAAITNKEVGFSTINFAIVNAVGTPNQQFSAIANGLVIIAMLPLAAMALFGLGQIIRERHFFKADPVMYGVLLMWFILVIQYFMFDKLVIINYRPVLEDGKVASSFPSSHTITAIFSLGCSWYFFQKFLQRKWVKIVYLLICIAISLGIAVSKILCSEHYLTDIIGSFLYCFFYMSGVIFFEPFFTNLFDKTIYKDRRRIDHPKM